MKVAVTGACGHIGNNLCKELLDQGFEVKALLLDCEELNQPEVEVIRGNVLNPDSLISLCSDVDYVFHLAAIISIDKKDQDLVYKVNVEGTKNIVDACKANNVKRLVHFSTIHTYNPHPLDEPLDETRSQLSHTDMMYEQSKLESELIIKKAISEGLDAVILHPTAVFGPNDHKPSLLGQALIKIYNNDIPMLVQGGYDWVDVRDIAKGTIDACKKGKKGEDYILSGKWMSLTDLSALIGSITNRKTPQKTASLFLARVGLPLIQFWATLRNEHPLYTKDTLDILKESHQDISCKKASDEFGYSPRPTEDSLKETFDWFKQNGMI